MAVFWIQQYYTLPVIFEHLGMGDELPNRRQPQLIDETDEQQRGTTLTHLLPPPQTNLNSHT